MKEKMEPFVSNDTKSEIEIKTISPKTAIIIITYNQVPNFAKLREYLNYVDYIFITDNGSEKYILNSLVNFSNEFRGRISLLLNNKNYGLSKPINDIVRHFNNYGIFWFYILDQDSIAHNQLFLESPKAWKECERKGINVGMIVPIVGDQANQLGTKFHITKNTSYIRSAITSGIYTNIKIFNLIGGFDEHFFVYGADIDFTIRARKNKFRICRLNYIYLIQNYGEIKDTFKLIPKIFFKLSNMSSLVNVKLGAINAYHSVIYDYSNQKIEVQINTSREINRKYKRYFSELYRLFQKYFSSIIRGDKQ